MRSPLPLVFHLPAKMPGGHVAPYRTLSSCAARSLVLRARAQETVLRSATDLSSVCSIHSHPVLEGTLEPPSCSISSGPSRARLVRATWWKWRAARRWFPPSLEPPPISALESQTCAVYSCRHCSAHVLIMSVVLTRPLFLPSAYAFAFLSIAHSPPNPGQGGKDSRLLPLSRRA